MEGLAEETDYDEATAVYMFHPFGAVTLRAVMKRIEETLSEHSRRVRLAYVNPVHEGVLRVDEEQAAVQLTR